MTDESRAGEQEEARHSEMYYRAHEEAPRAEKGWYHESKLGVQGPFASRDEAERDLASEG